MKQQKTLNKNKGITLIALVITIVVMLILVAVTISMAVNGGLFDYAGKATGDTKNALNEEQQLGNGGVTINDQYYNSIDEYLEASGNKGNGGDTGEGDETEEPEVTDPETPTGEGITAGTVQSNLTTYLGKKIAYGGTYEDASTYGNGEWEIFYADGEHIYIITKGHLANAALSITGYNGTSDFTTESIATKYPAVGAGLLNKTYDPTAAGTEADPYLKYTSTYDNMKATQYLLDSTVWATYANNEYAEWAIGGPTLELFVNSYNADYPDNAVTIATPTGNGYLYNDALYTSDSVPQDTYLNHYTSATPSPSYYWLACPSSRDNGGGISVRGVGGKYAYVGATSYNTPYAFRPVVCLDSDVQITWDSTNSEYTLSRAS